MSQKLKHGMLIGIAAAFIGLTLFYTGQLGWLENTTWDWRVRHNCAPSTQSDNIRLVFLDQLSLDWGAEQSLQWPWPRQVYSPILNFCKRGDAKSVAFDFVFTESSPYDVADDEILGTAIADFGKYVQAFQLKREPGSSASWPDAFHTPSYKVKGLEKYIETQPDQKNVMPQADFPIDEIGTKAMMLGSVEGVMDPDAIIRRVSLFNVFNGHFVPSLSLATFLAGNPDTSIAIDKSVLCVGNLRIPLDRNGRSILKYRGQSQTHKTVRMSAVINSELQIQENKIPAIDPVFFREKYVIAGFTAVGLRDLKPTPISKEYPGVEIHATALDNILNNDFIKDAPLTYVIICTVLFGCIAGYFGRSCSNWIYAVLAYILLLPMPLIAGHLSYSTNIWLPVAPSMIAVALALISALVINYAVEGKQKRFIKNAFKQYLSPAVIDRLLRDPDNLTLGGEKRELSIFFSDVQGFTTISEALEPEELTRLLNDYLSAMTSIIHNQGGTIDKYEGDAIIAFWNAPLDDSEHAKNAVRAALLGQEKLAELRPEFKERIGKDVFARIGINTGLVVVGNMGSEQRFDYTFLGDAGNLAARLEGINKQFGTFLMISQNTVNQLDDEFTCREISNVQVVGRKECVRVYEPYFTDKADTNLIKSFSNALSLYYNGSFKDAISAFETLADKDPVSAKYVQRCKNLADNPPAEWSGIWTMTEK